MEIVIYTDGSCKDFDDLGTVYSGAAIICREGADPVVLTTAGSDPMYTKHRNVSGEILAVRMACEYCMNTLHITQSDTVLIVHDYTGVHNWLKKPGEKDFWRAKNPVSMSYRDYMNTKMKTRCQLLFKNVKSHIRNGNRGNKLADHYAGEALASYVENMRTEG